MNALRLFAVMLGRRRWVMRLAPLIVPMDRRLQWLSRGRLSLLGLAGLPWVRLSTTGRRSGLERSSTLLAMPDGDGYVLTGSGWGRSNHPGWTANLIANPAARIATGDRMVPVRARLVTGTERVRLWSRLVEFWPGYEMEQRMCDRQFRVFVLEPRAP